MTGPIALLQDRLGSRMSSGSESDDDDSPETILRECTSCGTVFIQLPTAECAECGSEDVVIAEKDVGVPEEPV